MAGKYNKKSEEPVSLAETVESEMGLIAEAFRASPLFHDDPEKLPVPIRVAVWTVLDALEEMSKYRKALFRSKLLEDAESNGVPTDRGGSRLWIDNSEVVREKRQSKLPDDKKFRALLKKKGISLTEAYDEVKTFEMNPSRVDYLVQSGKLTEEEVKELCSVSWALKIKPSEMITQFLDGMMLRLADLKPGKKKED